MVVHEGAVPKTVIRIRTSTVIMAFVSQFLKWNCTVEKKQDVALCFCCLSPHIHIPIKKHKKSMHKNQYLLNAVVLLLFLLLQYNMRSCYTVAKLNCGSIQGSVARGNWNVTLYPFTLQKCSEKQNIALLPFPLFLSPSRPPLPRLHPTLFFLLSLQVSVFAFFIIFQLS